MKRFWDRVDKTDGCWNWMGVKNKKGYGSFGCIKGINLAHRASWFIHNGEIPKDKDNNYCGTKLVLHECDNPSCVNPDHLFLGTDVDNGRDKAEKGRAYKPIGVLNNTAILDDKKILEVRMWSKCGYTRKSVAKAYGVTPSTIQRAVSGFSWKHVSNTGE